MPNLSDLIKKVK